MSEAGRSKYVDSWADADTSSGWMFTWKHVLVYYVLYVSNPTYSRLFCA